MKRYAILSITLALLFPLFSGHREHPQQLSQPAIAHALPSSPTPKTKSLIPEAVTNSQQLNTNSFTISFEGASLHIPPQALPEDISISITTLEKEELALLNPDLVNVTAKHAAFRILPDGTVFQKDISIILPYDTTLIPPGYSSEDIRTFYFHEGEKRWFSIPKDSLQEKELLLVSRTNHFTDFINGVILIPDAPQSRAWTPNSIKDMDVANPAAGIVQIQPPEANAQGNANLSFPLKLPQGRQGIQPELSVQYNSSGENGWMGQGWDIPFSHIGIETRWGVPRYDPDKETETYVFDGGQLSPLAHRNLVFENRTAEKQFSQRIEGAFNHIIRHGNSPKNYWWEVTDKEGIKRFYGGLPDIGVLNNAVLKDDQGNIAYWSLVEVRDLNSNFVRYHCSIKSDPGVSGSSNPGRHIYVDRITYTGWGKTEGKYEIRLIRDDQLNEPRRQDVMISARLGFKQVIASLLRKVEIYFDGSPIRSYEFTYQEGAFYKQLLAGIIEYDRKGEAFYRNEFEYFDEVRQGTSYQPYIGRTAWNIASDNIRGDMIAPTQAFDDHATALSGAKSSSFGAGAAITVGPWGSIFSKRNTVGGNFSFSSSTGEGLLALVDINGDGLPDKVFREGNQLVYRANDGQGSFGSKKTISGISRFLGNKSRSRSGGFEAHPGPLFVGRSITTEETTTEIFFSDFNGDGLTDIAFRGVVFFGFINAQGEPEFSTGSGFTPSPVLAGNTIDSSLLPNDSLIQEQLTDEYPLHDLVRMWEAPRNGTISINAPVQLIQDNSQAFADDTLRDGVRVAIQLKDTELWFERILANDFLPKVPTGLNALPVNQGDRLYFRVQSIQNGAWDKVLWDPEITYDNISPAERDAQNHAVYRYQASEDYIQASSQSVFMPLDGTINIESTFEKPVLSDDITLEIIRRDAQGETAIFSQLYPWDTTVVGQSIAITAFAVNKDEEFFFRISSQTQVNWAGISWNPRLYYTAGQDTLGNPIQVIDATGNYLIDYCPAVEYTMYNHLQAPGRAWIANNNGTAIIGPDLTFAPTLPGQGANGTFTISLKGINKFYTKKTYQLQNSVLVGDTLPFSWPLQQDSVYFIEYHFSAADILEEILVVDLNLIYGGNAFTGLGVYARLGAEKLILGPHYRGWGHFAYNGNRGRADSAIQEALLVIDPSLSAQDLTNVSDPDDIPSWYDPTKADVITLISEPKYLRWRGFDDLTWISADSMSSSRLGEDNILIIRNLSAAAGSGLSTIQKISRSRTVSNAVAASPGGISGSLGYSTSETEILLDLTDFNGDRYPDISSSSRIQYTHPRGGLDTRVLNHQLSTHKSEAESAGFTLGGTFVQAKSENSDSPEGTTAKKDNPPPVKSESKAKGANKAPETAKSSVGLSGSFNDGSDKTAFTWMDINGDGLPDKLWDNGQVALNLGYDFLPPEAWPFSEIRAGESQDYGAGLGVNFANGSFMAGISLSRTESESNYAFIDVNGDGLLDIITSTNPLIVRLNRGADFGPAIDWGDPIKLDEGESVGESVNAAFTVCINIPIPFAPIRICFNPSANAGRGVSRQLTQFMDINGDGYPDFLESEDDGELFVRASTIGKTNLLKKVQRPLASAFSMDYELTESTYDMPQPRWLMNTVVLDDGFSGDGVDTMKNIFSYEAGMYDRHEREFLGFAVVRTDQIDVSNQDSILRTHISTFHNQHYYEKGLVKSQRTEDRQGNPFSETLYSYNFLDVNTGNPLPAGFENDDTGSAFPAMVREQTSYFEGQPTATLQKTTDYEYDDKGNVIRFTDFGDGSPNDQLQAFITYHNRPQSGIFSIPAAIEVFANNRIIRKREADIDATGSVTQIRQFLENGDVVINDMEYDARGNMVKLIRPENHRGERLFYAFTYDPEVNTYLTEINDGYGYRSTAAYDYSFGEIISESDINQQEFLFQLDDKGRIIQFTGPFELTAGKAYTIRYEYFPNATVPFAICRHYDPEHDQDINIYSFIDGLGRTIQTKRTASIFTHPNSADQVQMAVSGRLTFDALGRVTESFYPITEALGSEDQFSYNYDSEKPGTTSYDILDRNTRIGFPDGSEVLLDYDFAPDQSGDIHFQTIQTDALGNIRETFTDVRGRTRATNDHGPDGNIWTLFEYNAMSELTQVTDHENNEITYTYDHLGRQLSMDHPDGGLTETVYDLASNPIRKITANIRQQIPNGGAIVYSYDHERLIQVDYPKNYQNQVRYHYGEAGEPFNRVGRIWLREDASGGEEYYYDPLGNMSKRIRTLMISPEKQRTWVSTFTYDTWNRIQQMVYPDGERVEYDYNEAGKLISMHAQKEGHAYEIVRRLGYDKFEQRLFMELGNGSTTEYSYEADRRRLQHMKVFAPGDGGRVIMDNRYTYDVMSNVLAVSNAATIPSAFQLGGPVEHHYEYDQLYRLTKADGSWRGKNDVRSYSLAMAYDNLHNIRLKDQTHLHNDRDTLGQSSYKRSYSYDGDKPHAASQIGKRQYQYDANGNVMSWKTDRLFHTRDIKWDEENRIQAIIDNGYLSRYTYDAEGERALKSHGGLQAVFVNGEPAGFLDHFDNYTAYVSPYLVAREHTYTKHYYIETQRVLSKIGSGVFENTYSILAPNTAGSIDYGKKLAEQQAQVAAYYDSIHPGPVLDDIKEFIGQPEITGRPIPPTYNNGHYEIPPGWEKLLGPRNPDGPPGLPIPLQPMEDNSQLEAGYNFKGDHIFEEVNQYYYHPDHLGNTSFVTDVNGRVSQHLSYLPFGELFVEEYDTREQQPYLFSAKELDLETGYYYFGSRYYDPEASVWLGVDPLADHPNQVDKSPYAYTWNNPVNLTDPDGKCPICPWLDAVVDVGFVVYDAGVLIHEKVTTGSTSAANWAALGADVASIAVPMSVGAGQAARATVKAVSRADDAVDAAKAVDRATDAGSAVKKYDIGDFNDLQKRSQVGDGLDLHHVPQKKPAGQVIKDYDPKTAPAIALPQGQHKTIPTSKGKYTGKPRDLLAKDAQDLRNAGVPNTKVREMINYNKGKYPKAFRKKE